MNKLVTYLESKEVIFHGAIVLIVLYVPHAGHLFMQLEHLDMSISGYSVLNWVYAIALATVIEFIILVFIVNGYRNTGKFYATVCFFLNAFYYNYWFEALQNPTVVNIKLTTISFFVCLVHSLSVWQLSELFHKRMQKDKDKVIDLWCPECEAGPFPNKRSLDGHISKAHRHTPKLAKETIIKNGKPSEILMNQ